MFSKFVAEKSLSHVSTLGIGGPAKYFIEVYTIDEMQKTLLFCAQEKLSYFILGKGSNCLFDDRGFSGLVILNKIDFLEEKEPGFFYAGAGMSFSFLGVQTAKKQWSGLEFAAGIPASVGGAVFMNAGAQGKETFDSLMFVDFVNDRGECVRIKKEELQFSYRFSSFQKMKGAIVAAAFKLKSCPDARKTQLELVDYRIKTQPYQDKSAGCIFRNPSNGSAGSLIDKSGLKGQSVGGAQVSLMHANFLINSANATSSDMLELIRVVKTRVHAHCGVELESEVRIIPYEISE